MKSIISFTLTQFHYSLNKYNKFNLTKGQIKKLKFTIATIQ